MTNVIRARIFHHSWDHATQITVAVTGGEVPVGCGDRRVPDTALEGPSLKRAVKARSVVCLALLLLFTAWLSDTRPARGSPSPSARANWQGWLAPCTARNRRSPRAPSPQVLRLSAFDTRHAGTDELLFVRHRKHVRKRFRRRLLGPPFSTLPCKPPRNVDAVNALADADVEAPASSRDPVRAPPTSDQHD